MLLAVAPPLHDVQISHVTVFVPGPFLSILHPSQDRIANFSLTDSILSTAAERPSLLSLAEASKLRFSAAGSGAAGVIEHCFANAKITHNLIIGSRKAGRRAIWTHRVPRPRTGYPRPGQTGLRLCQAKDEKSSCKRLPSGRRCYGRQDMGLIWMRSKKLPVA